MEYKGPTTFVSFYQSAVFCHYLVYLVDFTQKWY